MKQKPHHFLNNMEPIDIESKQCCCRVRVTVYAAKLPTWNVLEYSVRNLPVVLPSDSLHRELNRFFYIVSEWVSGYFTVLLPLFF